MLGGSESPDEALLKRCAHFDLNGESKSAVAACDQIVSTRQAQLELCKQEITRQTGYARDAIKFFEGRHPSHSLDPKHAEQRKMPRQHFDDFQQKEIADCGDEDAVPMARRCVEEGMKRPTVAEKEFKKATANEKGFKDQMAWTRDQACSTPPSPPPPPPPPCLP